VTPRETPFLARLRRYARALAGPGAAPDELVRQTLERASHSLQPLGEDRESRIALFTLMHEIYSHGGTPERTHEFDRAISALPPEQREVFLLVAVEEMSYEDVAKTLNIPIGTVMSRLYRAREKLRAGLLGRSRLKSVK
jgi:RNA polymerase sigma-70 factor (ECF subfamily)